MVSADAPAAGHAGIRLALDAGWTVHAVSGDVPAHLAGRRVAATVPGCVHLDLLAAGLIPDPYLDENEAALAWVGRVDWRYECSVEWRGATREGDADEVVDLVALGLDTVATVEVNDTVVAHTQNMHRSYRFAVRDLLRQGPNEVAVTFRAGLSAAEAASEALGPRPHSNPHPFNALRKMACSFGWDWGPELVTAGIWKEICLESWSVARIASVRPLVEIEGADGLLHVHVEVQRGAGHDGALTLEVVVGQRRCETSVPAGHSTAVVEAAVQDVALWWPHGYGEQALYPVSLSLFDRDERLDHWEGRVGFRTIGLDTTPDTHGTPFTLSVNGIRVFARGVNWIPDDVFLPRVTRPRYAERLTQARDANANLVRVWGGGIYETEDFYDVCDELGLLVWQDFPFACAAYAEEEPLRGEVVAEAREAVSRLSAHPSLALWNGCNENIWGHEDWEWEEQLGERTWGWGYYAGILPSMVAELDPTRPYVPGSPYSMSPERHANDPAHGTMHIWDVWNDVDYGVYRDYTPRFVSEFGFQGPPTWTTLTGAVHDEPMSPQGAGMLGHQKAEDGMGKLARGLAPHLPEPTSFDDWHWATSLNQARAVAVGVEHFRSLTPVCMGAVVWQLNDCWPVTSWAAVDGGGRAKPLWYALRRSFRDRLLTFQPRPGGLALVAVNDSGERWTQDVQVTRHDFAGTVLASTLIRVDVEPRGAATLLLPTHVAVAGDPTREVLRASSTSDQAWWHFAEDVDAALPLPKLDVDVEVVDHGYGVKVFARTFVRDLAVLADRVAPDAVADQMLLTLLPGEVAVVGVRTTATVDPGRFSDPLVLRSANQLLHPTTD